MGEYDVAFAFRSEFRINLDILDISGIFLSNPMFHALT